MKYTALTVVVALLVAVACQPAQAATKTVLAEHRLEDGRKLIVPYCVISPEYIQMETMTQTTRIVGDTLAPPSAEQSMGEMEQTASLLNRMINTTELFFRGLRDVATAVGRTRLAGESNLRDPQARYDFWKEQGFYEKYTARERQFLNRVVFPAVAVGEMALAGCGAYMAASAITLGLGMSLAAVAPMALALGAVWAGITAYKAYRIWNDKAEVVRHTPLRPYGTYQGALSGLLGFGGLEAIGIARNVIPAFASEGAMSAGLATAYQVSISGLAGLGLMSLSSTGVTNLANVWGIPEESTITEVEEVEYKTTSRSEGTAEVELRYGLTK